MTKDLELDIQHIRILLKIAIEEHEKYCEMMDVHLGCVKRSLENLEKKHG